MKSEKIKEQLVFWTIGIYAFAFFLTNIRFFRTENIFFIPLLFDFSRVIYSIYLYHSEGKLNPTFSLTSSVLLATNVILCIALFYEYQVMYFMLLIFTITRFVQSIFPETDVISDRLRSYFNTKSKQNRLWSDLTVSIIYAVISVVLTLFILFLIVLFSGAHEYQIQIIPPIVMLALTTLIERVWKFKLVFAKFFQIAIILLIMWNFLYSWKCLWPNATVGGPKSSIGISERPARKVLTGGWMDGFYWMRFQATPEEAMQVVSSFTHKKYEQDGGITMQPLLKDSLLRVPSYGIHGNPWKKLTNECQHWYTDVDRLPVSIMYDAESQTMEIFEQTED